MDSWFRLQNSRTYNTIPFSSPPHWKTITFFIPHKNLQIQKMLKKDLSFFPSLYIHTYYGAEFRISGRVSTCPFHPSLLGMDILHLHEHEHRYRLRVNARTVDVAFSLSDFLVGCTTVAWVLAVCQVLTSFSSTQVVLPSRR